MEIVECEHCHQRWSAPEKRAVLQCPHCCEMTGYRAVAEERIERAKWTFDGAASIHEMASKLEARAEQLRNLAQDGWRLRKPVHDDYAYLQRDLPKEEKERHTIEVVVPAENDGRDYLIEHEMEEKDVEDWF